MIARVKAGTIGYIALCLHTRADGRQVWHPIGGDARGVIETSLTAAVRACIRSIDERFQGLRIDIAAARAQSRADRPSDDATADLLRGIEAKAAGLHREVARLLDEPTEHDAVLIATTVRRAQPSPYQLKAGRILAGLGVRDLAARTGLAFSTIQAIESGSTRRPRVATLEAMRSVLVDAGIEFGDAGWVRHGDDGDALTLGSTVSL